MPVIQPPRRNLPPDSELWGRSVDSRITNLELADSRQNQSISNSLLGLNATLIQLSNQISTLVTQQETLSSQQDQLTDLVSSLPVSRVQSNSSSNWQATNGGDIASFSLPWVAGKSRCDITVTSYGFYVADWSVPMSDRPAFRVRIANSDSPVVPRIPDNMDTYWFNGTYSRALTSPAPVSISLRTYTGPSLSAAYPENTAYITALAIFS